MRWSKRLRRCAVFTWGNRWIEQRPGRPWLRSSSGVADRTVVAPGDGDIPPSATFHRLTDDSAPCDQPNAGDSCRKDRLKCSCPGLRSRGYDAPISQKDIVKYFTSAFLGPKALT